MVGSGGLGRVVALGHEEDDLLEDAREDPLLEDDQPNRAEPSHEEGPDAGGVVHRQELGREDEPEPSPWPEEECGVDREGGPGRRQSAQDDARPEGCPARPGACLTVEVLIPDVRRVPQDDVVRRVRLDTEEVASPDLNLHTGVPQQLARPTRRRLVQLDTVESPGGDVGALPEICDPEGSGLEEDSLAARGFEDPVADTVYAPVGEVPRDGLWCEERTPRLPQLGRVPWEHHGAHLRAPFRHGLA